jgi:hypothetical protein
MNGPGERISVYPKDKQLVGQKSEIMLLASQGYLALQIHISRFRSSCSFDSSSMKFRKAAVSKRRR